MDYDDEEPLELTPWQGEVEAPFEASERELVADLDAVVEAVNLKPVKLTKSGIPPKPLWSAINQRLVWRDPASVMHDWEEVDQVRFVYLLAMHLDLFRPDADFWLHTGPGADAFFTCRALERARLIRRAYLAILDWDERCDARAESSSRHNFGKAYRRDFVHDVVTLRETALELLGDLPGQQWMPVEPLAYRLSQEVPDLLISEVCELPEVDESGVDPEKHRFVVWWLTLLGRFGWADMGRIPDRPERSSRLCRLTPLGAALVHGEQSLDADAVASLDALDDARPLLGVDPDGQVSFVDEDPAAAARFVAARLGHASGGGRNRRPTYRIDAESVRRASVDRADVARLGAFLERHADALPDALRQTLASEREAPASGAGSVVIVQNVAAVELVPGDAEGARALERAGFAPSATPSLEAEPRGATLTVADTLRTPVLFEAVGGEPWDGFDYPPDEPLATWRPGPSLHFYFGALPLQHRDLIAALGPEGDPPVIRFTAEKLAPLAERGWRVETLVAALSTLTGKRPSAKLLGRLRELMG